MAAVELAVVELAAVELAAVELAVVGGIGTVSGGCPRAWFCLRLPHKNRGNALPTSASDLGFAGPDSAWDALRSCWYGERKIWAVAWSESNETHSGPAAMMIAPKKPLANRQHECQQTWELGPAFRTVRPKKRCPADRVVLIEARIVLIEACLGPLVKCLTQFQFIDSSLNFAIVANKSSFQRTFFHACWRDYSEVTHSKPRRFFSTATAGV